MCIRDSGETARMSLGLGSVATQGADNVTITGGSVTGITDVAVADGGTGASDVATARQNLGVEIGVDVQGYDADLADLADGTLSASKVENGEYFIPAAGTSGQVWTSDGDGAGTWSTLSSGATSINGLSDAYASSNSILLAPTSEDSKWALSNLAAYSTRAASPFILTSSIIGFTFSKNTSKSFSDRCKRTLRLVLFSFDSS